ncbi:hypothetical protein A2160_03015 [Candidatus Beckwithbacteria bacterium RBG_13_42_9]|uniref:Glycosyltransferase RgtA/B/C/D-like domain-containing protein n=1 Tax=Candidatus Beckwithbacteria bacterium RBG_13_42_9 TaxID=1797457 RepID=A0A1F5E7N6_9BACT|nr:MAG: hypothetical protein A2160_03015 [Candidatus Beckwithbacteria bacterium RBG_13_42_9]
MGLKRLFLILLSIYIFLTGLVWAVVVPYNEAPDEYTHFDVANFMVQNRRLPIFGQDENMGVSKFEIPGVTLKYNASYSAMPPLAYLWQATFISLGKGNQAYLFARLADIILGIASAWVAFKLSKSLFKSFSLRAAFTVVGTITPQVLFSFVYVNSDAVLLLFSFIIWYWLVRLWTKTVNIHEALGFGLSLGLAALTRYNIVPLIILVIVAFLITIIKSLVKKQISLKKGLSIILTTFFTALISGGWWYLRNLVLYRDLLATEAFWQTYHQIYPFNDRLNGWQILTKTDWLWRNWQSLWGVFGWNTILMPDLIYKILLGFGALAIIFLLAFRANLNYQEKRVVFFSVLLLVSLVALSLWQSQTYGFQPQGRYLFPAWPGLVYLLIKGWQQTLPLKINHLKIINKKIFSFGLMIIWLYFDLYVLINFLIPSYY